MDQEKLCAEAKVKNELWGQTAKAVDTGEFLYVGER